MKRRRAGQTVQIIKYDLKSGQSKQLILVDDNNIFPAINSRGDKITFLSTGARNSLIFISDIAGRNVIQITQGKKGNASPVFSKDGVIYFCLNPGIVKNYPDHYCNF